MADKPRNNDGGDQEGVLASLPSTRPARMGRRVREEEAPTPDAASPAPKPKAGAPRTRTAPTTDKQGAARAKPPAAAKPSPPPRTRKPRAVHAGSPALKEPTAKAEELREEAAIDRTTPSGTELVATVVQAAGELAQIGLTVSGQILKRAVGRLPRP